MAARRRVRAVADRLHFLVWANSYDARADGEPIWWWARKAARLGATEGGAGRRRAARRHARPGSTAARVARSRCRSRAPRSCTASPSSSARSRPQPAPVAADAPSWRPTSSPRSPTAPGRPGSSPRPARARPACSPSATATSSPTAATSGRPCVALAYNKKAQEEMAGRLPGLGARIQTLNAWGYAHPRPGARPPPRRCSTSGRCAAIVERLVPVASSAAVNTDPIAPYLDGLSLIRLGLRRPAGGRGRARRRPRPGRRLRARTARSCGGGAPSTSTSRSSAPSRRSCTTASCAGRCRPTTATSSSTSSRTSPPPTCCSCGWRRAPPPTCSASGTTTRCIYGHVGRRSRGSSSTTRATSPGPAEHALEVNYRCPAAVTDGGGHPARRTTTCGCRRTIRPGPDVVTRRRTRSRCSTHAADAGAPALVDAVTGWLAEPDVATDRGGGAHPGAVAAARAPRGAGRGGRARRLDPRRERAHPPRGASRAGLPAHRRRPRPRRAGADLSEVHRRPSRGLPQWATKWLDRCRSIADVRQAAARIDDAKVARQARRPRRRPRPAGRASPAAGPRRATCSPPCATTSASGSAMTLLDSSGGASGSHLDDLEALLQVADLHPDAGSFEAWLRRRLPPRARPRAASPSRTIHRVKGREWDRVVVFGVTDGLMPHRLADGPRGGAPRPARRHHPWPRSGCSCSATAAADRRSSASSTAPRRATRPGAAPRPPPRRRRPGRPARPTSAPRSRPRSGCGSRCSAATRASSTRSPTTACASSSTAAARSSSASASGSLDGTPLTLGRPPSPLADAAPARAAGLAARAVEGRRRARLRRAVRQAPRRHRRAPPHRSWPSCGPARASAPPSSRPTARRSSRSSPAVEARLGDQPRRGRGGDCGRKYR